MRKKALFLLRQSIKRKKAVLAVAAEGNQLLGFTVFVVYKDMVMIDYLAVSSKIRSRGTGSRILEHICGQFPDKKIVLLIERVDDMAENCQQRTARRRFYLKKWFHFFRHFYNGCRRRHGSFKLRRNCFAGGIYGFTKICAWEAVFPFVADSAGRGVSIYL